MIQVEIPAHLRTLAGVTGNLTLQVEGPVTLCSVLDEAERQYPALAGTMRDHVTKERRPFIRFFACGEDFSHVSKEALLPEEVASGKEPLLVIGAIAGG